MSVLLVSTVLALVAAILFFWRKRWHRRLLYRIPGPPGLPLIGIAIELMIPRHELLHLGRKWLNVYGPVMRIEAFGDVRIILADPEACQVLLFSRTNMKKDSSYNFMKPWLGTGLLTSADSKWRSRRKMLDPAFHYKILEDFVHVFNANSAILVAKLREHTDDEYVEVNDFVALCALDIICETAMGTSVHAQSGEGVNYVHAVRRMCYFFVERHFSPLIHWNWIYYLTSMGREERQIVRVLQDFSGKIIRNKSEEYEARKSKSDPSRDEVKKKLSFLDMLLEMSDQEGKLTADDIREEVNTFMFAGHDTAAAAMSWALFLLGAHQDIQDKVVSELTDIFGSDQRHPTMADLQRMTYLDKVIKEVLRLYPSVPIISRILDTEVNIGDYTIPAGINVMVSPFLLHRNPVIYPDPERFDPERFSPDQAAGRHPCAYIPFSAGPRNCIGQKFAKYEMMSVLSSICRNFKLESLTDVKDVVIKGDIILKPLEPIKIKIYVRH